ncbi:MAG: AI-2E family transporter, partial [Chloroflexota bacterium]
MSRSWSKTTRYFVLALSLAAIVWFISAANGLVGPLVIAALLAYVLNPLVNLVNNSTKLPRTWVVLLVYLLSIAALVTTAIIFIPLVPDQLTLFLQELQEIQQELEASLPQSIGFGGFEISLTNLLQVPQVSTNLFQPDTDIIITAVQSATTNLGWVLVILVTTYYLLKDWPLFREWILGWAPDEYQYDAQRLYFEIRDVWQRYLRGQLRLMLFVGILTWLGSAAIGLPGAIAFGILAGLFDVVLSVGPAIVMGVAALVALYSGSLLYPNMNNVVFMLLVFAVYGGIQTVENIWLRPRIMGQQLKIHPAVLFVAVIGSLALGGVVVALIIIPVIGSVGILGRYTYSKILDIHPWPDLPPSPHEEAHRGDVCWRGCAPGPGPAL